MELNWSTFELKHKGKEEKAFQEMCYDLFCEKFEQKDGILAHLNNKALETEPIVIDGKSIGFQCKYFHGKPSLGKKKSILKNSLRKVKEEFPKLNQLYFYSNSSFYPSPKKGKQKSNPQLEIEKLAQELKIDLDWQLESKLYTQLEKNRLIRGKHFPIYQEASASIDYKKLPTPEQHLGLVRTALIQIEIKKLSHQFNPNNWREAEKIIAELWVYKDFTNNYISSSIINFLLDVAHSCRHGMTSGVLHELISTVEVYLPDKAGKEDTVSYQIYFLAIHIGFILAYDSAIELNNMDMLRDTLQLWKHVQREASINKDPRIIEELEKNYSDLLEHVERRNRADLSDAIWLIQIFKADLKKPEHRTPKLPDDLFYRIKRDRDKADRYRREKR